MARVPNCKGSYSHHGSSWQVKIALGWSEEKKRYDSYNENLSSEAEAIMLIKEINTYIYHGGKWEDVPAWRKGLLSETQPLQTPDRPDDKGKSELTVGGFAEEFNRIREKQGMVAPRTIESDKVCFARIAPYIGDMKLTDLSPHDIDNAYACMRSEGPENLRGEPYSGTSLQKTHAFLKMLFKKAVNYNLIEKNPCDRVEPPRRDTAEKQSLSSEQAKDLYHYILAEEFNAHGIGVLLCLCCGLRLSEMLALKWEDYQRGTLSVTKALMQNKQGFKETKTKDSRIVPCPPPLLPILDDWKGAQRAWFRSAGIVWSEKAPLVHSRVGNHMLQRSFEKWFKNARRDEAEDEEEEKTAEKDRKRLPVPKGFQIHWLRHSYVTLLNKDCGIDPRTTRSLSGHKSDQAFAIYTHTDTEWQQRAVASFGDIIAPDASNARCINCKFWSPSPLDSTKGTCWQEGNLATVTDAATKCPTGQFCMRIK